ncbi:MAG: ribosome silencing factor [Alkalispirochaeta sp.]
MDQSSERSNATIAAQEIAEYLEEHGGENVVALDISKQSGFVDSFVFVSAPSIGRLRGLYRRAHEKIAELELTPRQSHKRDDESGWLLIDCESVIVHLMLTELRDFYEVEKLWFDAVPIYP